MKKIVILFFIAISATGFASAKIDLNGAIRNDSLLLINNGDSTYINILENKLIFQRQAEQWKFYSDVRINLFTSSLFEDETNLPEGLDLVDVSLLRVFIKYYATFGDMTIGKTYINFGNIGVFNPFELDQGVNVSDLNYSKSGLVALNLDFSMGDLSGAKLFISPEAADTEAAFGGSLFTNLGSFDLGMIMNRLNQEDNIAGVYFKGDIELGVQGSLAYHFDDNAGNDFSEIVFGLDYSFFDGELLVMCQGYYNGGNGVISLAPSSSTFFTIGGTQLEAEAFPDKFYLYANITYRPDEFIGWQLDSFINIQDRSSLILPTVNYTLADGLYLTGQVILPTGVGKSQYSRDLYGDAILVVRLEAKL